MYSIAILDDEDACVEDLRTRVMGHPLASQFDISVCTSAPELVSLAEKRHIDVLFADIRLSGATGDEDNASAGQADGIDVVKSLDLQALGTQVIYVTGLDGMYARVRRSQMAQFLMKPVRTDELYSVIDKALVGVCTWKPKIIQVRHAYGVCMIDPRDVAYVKSEKRNVEVHYRNKKHRRVPMRLTDMYEQLPDFFFQVHRSYIVNLGYVNELRREPNQQKFMLELTNGDMLTVPRKRWQAVVDALEQYKHSYNRAVCCDPVETRNSGEA